MDKERKKIIRRRLGWFAIRGFTYLSGRFSLGLNYFIGNFLGSIAYAVVFRHRKIALASLSVAFPNLSQKAKKRIARNFFILMAQGSFELLHFLKNPDKLRNVLIEGGQFLKQALNKKKGVIILTAHLGNFPLMSLKLAKEKFPINIVTRPMRDKRAGDYLHDLRTKAGVKTIFSYPRRDCVMGIINALRNNEVVIIQMDQNFGTGGVWVKFFGKLAATSIGPIVFALRTKAAVIPAYIHRQGCGKHCIKIFPESDLILKDDKNETILLNAIKFTRIIENWIKEFPSQWSWIHKRWKSRPSEAMKKSKFKVER